MRLLPFLGLLALTMSAETFVQAQNAPAKPRFRFASGAGASDIPIEIVANGLVFVRAEVNGHSGWFILDNATQGFLADKDFAERISLASSESASSSGAGKNPIQGGIAQDVKIDLPGLELSHRNVLIIPLKSIEPSVGHEVDGILGSSLFEDFDVMIDYERNKVSISPPGNTQVPSSETAIRVAVDEHGFPYLDASITLPGAAPVEGRFLIDGGANTYADIYKPFADAHHIPPSGMKLQDDPGTSAGGVTESKRGRATRISVGSFSVSDPTVTFARDTQGLLAASNYAGLIGTEFLERFTVIFDNPGKRVLLSPNHRYGDPVETDESGLRLHAEGPGFHRFVVVRVLTPSPAADAGIASGDVLESIDGRAAETLTLTELRSMLCRPNAHYSVGVARHDKHLQFLLILRSLI